MADTTANENQPPDPSQASPADEPPTEVAGDSAEHDAGADAANINSVEIQGAPLRPAPPREDRLFLPDTGKLRPGLAHTFDRILARAAAQAERADVEAEPAVHEFRKSVRRARALLAMLRPSLRKSDFQQMADALRTAHRATSGLRDSDVLLKTLKRVVAGARDREGVKEAADAWRGQLTTRARGANAPGEAARVLREAAATLPAVSAAFAEALPPKTGWNDLRRGVRRAYRRAQAARDEAVEAGQDEPLHDWRKRVKELNYQLEVLTRGSTLGPVAVRKSFADLAEALGEITDRLVLRDAFDGTASAADDASVQLLRRVVDEDIERRRLLVLAESDELMTNDCKAFVGGLIGAARSDRRRVVLADPA